MTALSCTVIIAWFIVFYVCKFNHMFLSAEGIHLCASRCRMGGGGEDGASASRRRIWKKRGGLGRRWSQCFALLFRAVEDGASS